MSTNTSSVLTDTQIQAVVLLAVGKSATVVATQLKLNQNTLSSWKKNPAFIGLLEKIARISNERRAQHFLQKTNPTNQKRT